MDLLKFIRFGCVLAGTSGIFWMFGNVCESKARWCVKREGQDVYTATRKQDYCLDSQIKQQELHLPLSLQCTTLADQLTRVF